jgi:hypothetical protein
MTIPLQDEQSTMEVLVCWDCSCTAPRWACPDCDGEGIIDAWLPREDVASMQRPCIVSSSERIRKAA